MFIGIREYTRVCQYFRKPHIIIEFLVLCNWHKYMEYLNIFYDNILYILYNLEFSIGSSLHFGNISSNPYCEYKNSKNS